MTLNDQAIHYGLSELQELAGSTAAAKGFHDDRPTVIADETGSVAVKDVRALEHWQGNKLMLIVSEAVEAHDEIRSGHAADETYYPTAPKDSHAERPEPGSPHKPEGVPSEVADIVIRAFDFAYTEGFSLADIIIEKLAFNATRERLHGKQF